LAGILLSACGTLPVVSDRAPSRAQQPSADSPLVRIVDSSTLDPAMTGFRLMPLGFYSLDARVELMRRATHSLDVQYYLIQNDRTAPVDARPARCRCACACVFSSTISTRSAEIRCSAAWRHFPTSRFGSSIRSVVAAEHHQQVPGLARGLQRLNHRMHNKLFIADSVVAVMGGRNIADEYFTRNPTSNFVDMDVLVVGAVVPRLASIFDVYWNSPQAYPSRPSFRKRRSRYAARAFDHLVDEGEQMRSIPVPPVDMFGHGPIATDSTRDVCASVGNGSRIADQPAKVMATSDEMARGMSVQMSIMDRVMASKKDVVISSPYFVPGSTGVHAFGELSKRDVKVAILTNSLAANDVPLVHTGYARYRVALLRTGVDLYELSPTRMPHEEELIVPAMSLGRLHAKAAVIDRSTVYIGSMNLDPRSESTNTELGILAECPELARQVGDVIEASRRRSAYKLRFAADGETLEWFAMGTEGEVVFAQEPEATPYMLFRTRLFGPFVPEQLL
jgi:putative cardiolipin synthase